MMKIRGNRVLVYIENKEEEITSYGIILPKETKDDDALVGEIISIGFGDELSDLHANVGSKVLFPSYAGTKYKKRGKEYIILNSSDVLAVLDDESLDE